MYPLCINVKGTKDAYNFFVVVVPHWWWSWWWCLVEHLRAWMWLSVVLGLSGYVLVMILESSSSQLESRMPCETLGNF